MISRSFPLLPFAVLIVLAALTFWLSQFVNVQNANNKGKDRDDADMVIEKFSAKKLSETGDVQYKLDADKMTHFPVSDSAKFEQVTFSATTPDKPSLEARAPRGSSLKGGDEVILDGGVVVNSSATKNSPAVVFTTPKLTLLPDTQIARSVDGVVAESAMGTISASTFVFNNETRIAEFKRGKLVINKASAVRNTKPNANANKP